MSIFKSISRRGLALFLALTMCLSLLQVTAFAEDMDSGSGTEPTVGYTCGKEEHTHTDACYETTTTRGELTCALEESEGHTHGDGCYGEDGGLVCALEESEGHTHGDGCYEAVTVRGELTCTKEEHTHTDECLAKAEPPVENEPQPELVCTCTAKCGGDSVNAECPVCGTEGADLTACTGKEAVTEVPEAAQAFLDAVAALPALADIPEKATAAEIAALSAKVDACETAFNALSEEDMEREDVAAAIVTLGEVTGAVGGIQVLGEVERPLDQWNTMSEEERTALLDSFTESGVYRSSDWSVVVFKGGPDAPFVWPGLFDWWTETGYGDHQAEIRKVVKELIVVGNVDFSQSAHKITFGECWYKLEKITLNNVNLPDESTVFTSAGGNIALTVNGGSIGKNVFKQSGIKTATLNNVTLGEGVFAESYGLESVVLNGIETIPAEAFQWCENLKTVQAEDATDIGRAAFRSCTSLKELSLPKASSVGFGIISDSGVETVTIGRPKTLTWFAFSSAGSLKNVTLGSSDYTWNVAASDIGTGLFSGCDGVLNLTLNNVNFPDYTGSYPFQSLSMTLNGRLHLTVNGGKLGKYTFRNCANLETVTLSNMTEVGKYVFYINKNLTEVNITDVDRIATYAFHTPAKLTTINLTNVKRIDGNAFYGCDKAVTVSLNNSGEQLGYISAGTLLDDENISGITGRVEDIFKGQFELAYYPPDILRLEPEAGWVDPQVKVERSPNWNTYNYGTQLMERAQWTNDARTEAEVQVDAYYTAPEQMDFIFVADLSNSMADLGNDADLNSRFYDMQSKLTDVANQLLSVGNYYDCQMAIVIFGGKFGTRETSDKLDFTKDASVVADYINKLTPLYESTDYGLGLKLACDLAAGNTGRNTTVVFLSDGAPTANGSGDQGGTMYAGKIRNELNVPILGVLHSPTAPTSAGEAMDAVCDQVFLAHDTESFGEAMNLAFSPRYPDYQVTIPVNPAFENVRDLDFNVTAGTATYNEDTHTITWTITGLPFIKHTLTYSMSLTPENANRTGDQTYPVNVVTGAVDTGTAEIKSNDPAIPSGNTVPSPVLERSVPVPPTPVETYTLTVRYVYEDGTTAAATVTRTGLAEGTPYSVTSPGIAGYTPDQAVVSGTMPARNVEVVVTYRAATAGYRVVHEYYTNGTLTGSSSTAMTAAIGSVINVAGIAREPVYGGDTYGYTSTTPASATVAADGSTVITLRYDRTVTGPVTPVDPVTPVTPNEPDTPTPIPDTPTPVGPTPGTDIADPDVPLGLVGLNTVDHIAYIIGYEDGLVHPESSITRAEVATIFFRLMTDEFRTANWATQSAFPDVASANWFNNAVSTNGKAGIVKGYMDGEFKPNQNITRAEFAAIAARFLSDEDVGPGGRFSDISGHWAEEEINRAVAAGWIRGYEDGTFRPDQDITRAEAVTLINRMLDRMPDKDHLLENMITWPDNTEDKWYYEDMQEATNSHDYDRAEDGIMEVWTEKLEERKWKEFEYEWSTAASAPGREVADNLHGSSEPEGEGEAEAAPEATGDGEE